MTQAKKKKKSHVGFLVFDYYFKGDDYTLIGSTVLIVGTNVASILSSTSLASCSWLLYKDSAIRVKIEFLVKKKKNVPYLIFNFLILDSNTNSFRLHNASSWFVSSN